MKSHEIELRVRYQETDRMGVVYYGNYFVWFEVARTELFRKHGLSYVDMEKEGFRLMVVDARCSYKKSATYDDLVRIRTNIKNTKNTSIGFSYEVFCNDALIARGETEHVFTDANGKPVRIPEVVKEKLIAKESSLA